MLQKGDIGIIYGFYKGYIEVKQGLQRDKGKEHGNYSFRVLGIRVIIIIIVITLFLFFLCFTREWVQCSGRRTWLWGVLAFQVYVSAPPCHHGYRSCGRGRGGGRSGGGGGGGGASSSAAPDVANYGFCCCDYCLRPPLSSAFWNPCSASRMLEPELLYVVQHTYSIQSFT